MFGAVDAQVAAVALALQSLPARGAGESRLVVLPETCATGYVSPRGNFDLSHFAEPADGPLARAWAALARAHDVTLVAPIVEAEMRAFYNTTLVFDPGGACVARYRKHHPWFPETWATPGAEPVGTFTLGDLRCALFVCFDVHFVRNEAAAALDAADVLVFPSAWVEGNPDRSGAEGETRPDRSGAEGETRPDRSGAEGETRPDEGGDREALLLEIARAHDACIINANWGAGVPRVRGQGGSLILDARGTRVGTTLALPGGVRAVIHGTGMEPRR